MLVRTFFFEPLYPFCADLLVVDPPWMTDLWSDKGEAKSPQAHYDCMPDAEIAALPVLELASRDCWILWVTAPKLDFCIECMKGWGFRYVSFFVWRKVTKNGKRAIGPGYIVRTEAELIVIGAIGDPSRTKPLDGIFDGVRREHSRKPDEFYSRVEAFAPHARKVDVFGRQGRSGWSTWGKEASRFDGASPAPALCLPRADLIAPAPLVPTLPLFEATP